MSFHEVTPRGDVHGIHYWTYASTADRDSHTPSEGPGRAINATDVTHKRICLVSADNLFYVLTNHSPVTWRALSGTDGKPTTQNKNMAALATAGDGDQACAVAIQKTPPADGFVRVLANGGGQVLGDGVKTVDCYFSGDAGATARAIADIVSGDVLFWNGSIAGFQLTTADRLSFDYQEAV